MKQRYTIKRSGATLDWATAGVLSGFSYPWRDETPPRTEFRALWDERCLYCRFDATDPDVHIFREVDHKLEVVCSDRVEIFFRPNVQMNPYYCLEIDPLGRVLDYRAVYHRQFDYQWSWGNGIDVEASRRSDGYCVSVTLTLDSLRGKGLLNSGRIEAGLYRANCQHLENKDARFNWISWVVPEVSEPDFHIPGTFAELILEGYPH